MPKISQKSKVKIEKSGKDKAKDSAESYSEISSKIPSKSRRPGKKLLIALIIVALLALFYFKKNWFVAALVDGRPITNLELQIEMNKLYRQKALDKLISDKIIDQIEQEASSKGIVISQQEIDQKLKEDENQYGGAQSFESLLSQQGISKEDYIKYDIKVKFLGEKLYQSQSQPTEQEIQQAMDQNKDAPEATEPAKFRQLVEQGLKSQKANDLLGKKYQELKSKVITF